MKIVAIIPARIGSTRLNNKMLLDLEGEPLILRTYNRVKSSDIFSKVIVATDSEEIEEVIKQANGLVFRSKKEHFSGTDRIAEVAENIDCDVVVNIQGDEPFISNQTLQKVCAEFKNEDIQIVSAFFEIDNSTDFNNPNNVKVVCDINDFALYFSRANIPFSRNNTEFDFRKHIGIYAFQKNVLLNLVKLPTSKHEKREKLEQLRFLENGYKIKMVKVDSVEIGVDTEDDLELARKKLREMKLKLMGE